MAVVNRLSGVITNRDATPRVMNNPGAAAGMLRGFSGTLETVSGDDIASTYRFAQVPSNAVMHALRLYCDDVGSTALVDIGIYRTTADGGAVVDADVFGSAVDISGGALNGTDVLNESAVTAWGLEDAETPLWQALGLTADPMVNYDVVLTLTVASNAAATITLRGIYAI
jgi:hypothetical protein